MTLLTGENKHNAGKATNKKNDHRDSEKQCQTPVQVIRVFFEQ